MPPWGPRRIVPVQLLLWRHCPRGLYSAAAFGSRLDWAGVDWVGLAWAALAWAGLGWAGLDWVYLYLADAASASTLSLTHTLLLSLLSST